MIDAMSRHEPHILDLKTTGGGVSNDDVDKRIYEMSYDLQAAANVEALERINPEYAGRVKFTFLFQEQKFPYALSEPVEMSTSALELGREKWRIAGTMWDDCVAADHFPGNPTKPRVLVPPDYEISRWQNRLMFDETLSVRRAA